MGWFRRRRERLEAIDWLMKQFPETSDELLRAKVEISKLKRKVAQLSAICSNADYQRVYSEDVERRTVLKNEGYVLCGIYNESEETWVRR